MATARRLVEADRYTREGRFRQWEYMVLQGGDVHGKTLGVVGFGRIGRAMARRALGFGMRVLYQDAVAADPATERELNATRADLATLLRESDFVTLHTPLIPETRHLINAESLRTMKKTAYLINASRGPVVDEAALVQALGEGRIAGAGLDVFEEEPTVHPGLIGPAQRGAGAPHRQRLPRDAPQDGDARGRELPGRAGGQDPADAGESRGPEARLAVDLLLLDRISKRFAAGRPARGRRSVPPGGGRRDPRAARPVRLRQDHHAAPHRRPREPRRGHDHAARAGRGRSRPRRPARGARDRHRLPGLRALPPPDRRRQRGLRPDARRPGASRVEQVLDLVGLGGFGAALPARALGRPAAARGPRARAGARPGPDAARRALLQPGRRSPRPDARRGRAHSPDERHDRGVRHPRSGGGLHAGRSRGRAPGRAHRAARAPAGALPSARHALRGRLRRRRRLPPGRGDRARHRDRGGDIRQRGPAPDRRARST